MGLRTVASVRHPGRFSGMPPASEIRLGAKGERLGSTNAGSVEKSTPRKRA